MFKPGDKVLWLRQFIANGSFKQYSATIKEIYQEYAIIEVDCDQSIQLARLDRLTHEIEEKISEKFLTQDYKDLAKRVVMQAQSLNKTDAIIFADLFLKSFNAERECYTDNLMYERDFHKLLSEFDIRFREE